MVFYLHDDQYGVSTSNKNACSLETSFSMVPGTHKWTDHQVGRVLFTDENCFSLISNSGCIHIWGGLKKRNNPSEIIKRDMFEDSEDLVGGSILLGSHNDLYIFQGGSITGAYYFSSF